ncbi:hypothetical protein [Nostoc punctiforme]|uniref:hypothetical protein n=1 Tax=Nostoc punctiforme TaxID=272131 RepID=UPI0003088FE2|nr:hypothetical protein [Nostoc punctiforme]
MYLKPFPFSRTVLGTQPTNYLNAIAALHSTSNSSKDASVFEEEQWLRQHY